jgi:hypothetical protein
VEHLLVQLRRHRVQEALQEREPPGRRFDVREVVDLVDRLQRTATLANANC